MQGNSHEVIILIRDVNQNQSVTLLDEESYAKKKKKKPHTPLTQDYFITENVTYT